MKRYRILLCGPVTEEKWVQVFESDLKSRLDRHLLIWKQSHGIDHKIRVVDQRELDNLDRFDW